MKQVSIIGFPSYILMVLIAALTITGCNKEVNNPNPVPTPTPNPPFPPAASLSVSGIKPTTGAYNTAVTITGTGFSSTLAFPTSAYWAPQGVTMDRSGNLYAASNNQASFPPLPAVVPSRKRTEQVQGPALPNLRISASMATAIYT